MGDDAIPESNTDKNISQETFHPGETTKSMSSKMDTKETCTGICVPQACSEVVGKSDSSVDHHPNSVDQQVRLPPSGSTCKVHEAQTSYVDQALRNPKPANVWWGSLDPSTMKDKVLWVDPVCMSINIVGIAELSAHTLRIPQHAAMIRERWYIPVKIITTETDFLLDTGATTSLVTRKFYDSLPDRPPMVPTNTLVAVANGEPIRTEGLGCFPIEINKCVYMISCLIVSGLEGTEDGILGADFFHVHRCNIDWSGRFSLDDGAIETMCRTRGALSAARLVADITLLPETVKLAMVNVRPARADKMLMFEPDQSGLLEWAIGSANTLLPPGSPLLIPLCNPTGSTVVLHQGAHVGSIHMADQIETIDDELIAPEVPIPPAAECPLNRAMLDSHVADGKERARAIKVLLEYADCFSMPGDQLGHTERVKHVINTGDHEPIRQAYRRLPVHRKEVAESQIRDMLIKDMIRPCNGPWASPIVMVRKKDGSIRFCVDYRKVNAVTKIDGYPLPRIDENLEALGGNMYFCTLDLESGYWQIAMEEDSAEKTAFISSMGLFQFKVMSFGLCNAPATFERMMDEMLDGLRWTKCLVYLDDIIVYGKTFEETLSNLRCVLERIREWGLKLKPKKCKLFRTEVEFLGRVVSAQGMTADPGKVQTVLDWPVPKTVRQVRQFLGFASYYREFQEKFAEVTQPLQAIVNKATENQVRRRAPIIWTPECELAFQKVKHALCTAPLLHYPTRDDPFILDTDASGWAMAGVLSQIQQGKECLLSYASNTLSRSQRNYSATKRELLAVVTYLKKFRHYLLGNENYIVRTDHASLRWLLNFKDPQDMLARWLTILQEFHLTHEKIVHRAGKKHVNADALSRVPESDDEGARCNDCGDHHAVVNSLRTDWTVDIREQIGKIQRVQEEDPVVGRILRILRKEEKAPEPASAESDEFRTLLSFRKELRIIKGILYVAWTHSHTGEVYNRIVVPAAMRAEIFLSIHGPKTAGHWGNFKTAWSLRHRYYWPGLRGDIRRWIHACDVCNMRKVRSGRGITPLKKQLHGERFSRISMDIIGPFKRSPRGNTCILVITDYFSKWAETFPLSTHTASDIAHVVFQEWILRFGAPVSMQTDGAPEFRSVLMEDLCTHFGIEKVLTLPYRPQSNGQVERFNRVLVEQLSCLSDYDSTNWDLLAPCVAHAYRATVHKCTGCTPNSVVFGTELWTPADLIYGIPKGGLEFPCRVAYVEELKKQMRRGHQFVRERLGVAADYQRREFDKRARPQTFHPGDMVYRYYPPKANQKYGWKFDGPYEVIRFNGTTYDLKTTQGILRWNKDLLKPSYDESGLVRTVNLERAPEFVRLREQGRDILRVEKGVVKKGDEYPAVKVKQKVNLWVKPRGRPKKPKHVPAPTVEVKTPVTGSQPTRGSRKRGRPRKRDHKQSRNEQPVDSPTRIPTEVLDTDLGRGKRKRKQVNRLGIQE